MFVPLVILFYYPIYKYQIRRTSCKMEPFLYTSIQSSSTYRKISTLHIEYSSPVVIHTNLYLQKIRIIFIKIVDMRTNMIKSE